ncbi:MAG: hypothetical protein C5S47_06585 [Candidatus Methanogasteraceae archaeon]|nr:MAG: hypothetical protein C5S47_06585 [ANME-2 cluster archaeon]
MYFSGTQPKIPMKYTRRLLFFAPSRLCIFALLFSNLTQGRKGAETRRVLSISVFTSFALLYIQLTITKITIFPDSAKKSMLYDNRTFRTCFCKKIYFLQMVNSG